MGLIPVMESKARIMGISVVPPFAKQTSIPAVSMVFRRASAPFMGPSPPLFRSSEAAAVLADAAAGSR